MIIKKLLIYASFLGLGTGVVYRLCKKRKFNNIVSKPVYNKVDFEPKTQDEDISQELNLKEEMYPAKSESLQNLCNRHSKAGEIIEEGYRNIIEDFVEDFSGEEVVNEKDKSKECVIDSKSVSVMKEIDLISNEIDDLLK